MIVTIWRHAEAGRAASDRERELTDAGMDDVGFACRQFHDACRARQIPQPDRILHSPWVRTNQTADIIAAAFTHATLAPTEVLQPGSDVKAVNNTLVEIGTGQDPQEHVLLVSHQPLVSYLLDHYLGESAVAPSLPAGGLATLALDTPARDCGRLLFWALPPEFKAAR